MPLLAMTQRARAFGNLAVDFTPIPHFRGGWMVRLPINNKFASLCPLSVASGVYTHTNLDSKKAAVAKLESFRVNLVTVHQNQQAGTKTVTKNSAKSCCKLYLETEEWVSG
jgi:hypothetical protein